MAVPTGKHGKRGRVTIGTTNYRVTEWDGDDTTESVPITSTEDNGYETLDRDGGIEKWSGSITVVAAGGQATPTKGMCNLKLYEGGQTSADCYSFVAFISSVRHANRVKGSEPITYVLAYESSGVISRGTDTIANPYS